MFSGGIRLFKLFGTEIFLQPLWFVVLFIFALPPLLGGNIIGAVAVVLLLGCLYISVIGHEFAHIFAGRYFGVQTPKIVINFFGGAAMMERIPFGLPEAIIGMVGPLFSYAVGMIIMLPFFLGVPHNNLVLEFIYNVGYVNLLLGLFNTLPIFPMDGGRILRGVLFYFNNKIVRSTKIAMIVGFITLPFAFITLIPINMFSIVIMGLLVWMCWGEWKQVQMIYRDDMKDPNLVRPDQVAWYAMVVSLYGPGSKQANDARTMYSNIEFDKLADQTDAEWQASSPAEKLKTQALAVQYLLEKHDPEALSQLQDVLGKDLLGKNKQ